MVTDLWRGLHRMAPAGRTVLDVGGGPGFFAAAFTKAGMRYIGVEPDATEMHAGPAAVDRAVTYVRASGMALPFADGSVDICLSSNVAEHVAQPWRLGREMLRVTRPGGLVVLSYTVWLGPFGGHEMGLSHSVGGRGAAVGGEHGCAGRRISPLPPAMGVVADAGPGAAGIRGEQSGAGASSALTA
jgi:SAM-dependent methyltransferase